MFAKAIIILSIYIVPFVFILTTPMNIGLVVLLVILMGVGEAVIGMSVMHDATKDAFSSKQWVNNLFVSVFNLKPIFIDALISHTRD